jgi:hypothetical protein
MSPHDVEVGRRIVQRDLAALAAVAEQFRGESGGPPADEEELYRVWGQQPLGQREPMDPFDGRHYGYAVQGDRFYLWSSGPDGETGTQDDIALGSRDGEDAEETSGGR